MSTSELGPRSGRGLMHGRFSGEAGKLAGLTRQLFTTHGPILVKNLVKYPSPTLGPKGNIITLIRTSLGRRPIGQCSLLRPVDKQQRLVADTPRRGVLAQREKPSSVRFRTVGSLPYVGRLHSVPTPVAPACQQSWLCCSKFRKRRQLQLNAKRHHSGTGLYIRVSLLLLSTSPVDLRRMVCLLGSLWGLGSFIRPSSIA